MKQEIEAFSLKEDGEMNASELQSYYADMPELQFHQLMKIGISLLKSSVILFLDLQTPLIL